MPHPYPQWARRNAAVHPGSRPLPTTPKQEQSSIGGRGGIKAAKANASFIINNFDSVAGQRSPPQVRATSPTSCRRRKAKAPATSQCSPQSAAPHGAAFGGSRHRQIAAHCRSCGTPCSRTAYTIALFLLAPAHRQRVLSYHQSDGSHRWNSTRRQRQSKAGQARCAARADLAIHRTAALLAEMLSVSNDGRYPSLDGVTAEQRRQRTLEALTSQMETLARQNPVLMIFEDAHWADPTSLEVLSRCVDQIAALRARCSAATAEHRRSGSLPTRRPCLSFLQTFSPPFYPRQ
jgi:hypothetical protein